MTAQAHTTGQSVTASHSWYSRTPAQVAAAVECRSETGTALTTATFDSKQMNWAMLWEFILAVLVTQMDLFNRLLGTTQINLRQFGWALIPALALLLLWELGRYVARRRRETTQVTNNSATS